MGRLGGVGVEDFGISIGLGLGLRFSWGLLRKGVAGFSSGVRTQQSFLRSFCRMRWAIESAAMKFTRLLLVTVAASMLTGCGYNRLVSLKQQTDSSWADVENVYQRRADLVPNLVKTVEGAATFEKDTLTQVIEARQQVNNIKIDPASPPATPEAMQAFQQTQDGLSSALSRVTVERYPDIKANANFRDLQVQLEGTENRIAVERRKFNESVQQYNTATKQFPTVLYSGLLGFKERPYFAARAGADQAPDVNFNFGGTPGS
jgi:LemA protein